MCDCPNEAAGKSAMVALLVILAEISTIFSHLIVLIFGLIAMICNLLPLCKKMRMEELICGGFLAGLVSIGQIVTAATIDEGSLQFCDANLDYDMEGTAFCNLSTYRIANAVGAGLWIVGGSIEVTIPEPGRSRTAVVPVQSSPYQSGPVASRTSTASGTKSDTAVTTSSLAGTMAEV